MAAGLTQYRAYSTDEVCLQLPFFADLNFDRLLIGFQKVNIVWSFFVLSQVMQLLQRGNQNRTTEPTRCNETSSRSHAILQVTIELKSHNLKFYESVFSFFLMPLFCV